MAARTRSKGWLRNRLDTYRRLLIAMHAAAETEITAVLDGLPKDATKDELWQALAQLMSLARRREWTGERPAPALVNQLDAALDALKDREERLTLQDGTELVIRPASYARMMVIEDVDFWIYRVAATRKHFLDQARRGGSENGLTDLLHRLETELNDRRALLFAQVAAPTAAPATDVPAWASRLLPQEERALLQAWHRVNLEPILAMPKPRGRGGQELPTHWSFLLSSVAWREKRPALEVVRDRSLVSIVAETTLEGLRDEQRAKKVAKK